MGKQVNINSYILFNVLNNFEKKKNYLESGHYYSFIHDFEKNIWRRFNDITITEETEENVFKESWGFLLILLKFII